MDYYVFTINQEHVLFTEIQHIFSCNAGFTISLSFSFCVSSFIVRDIKYYFHAQINEELFLCEEKRVWITRYIAINMFDDGTEISCIRPPDSNETTAKNTITHETNLLV